MMIKVAACQLVLSIENPEENFLSICNAVSNCVTAGAQLIVIPELSNSGYVLRILRNSLKDLGNCQIAVLKN
jgi:predicted amidohydrolase